MTFQKGRHEATGNLLILRNSKRTIDAFRNQLFFELQQFFNEPNCLRQQSLFLLQIGQQLLPIDDLA
jgi:hypothetical protein